jgi:hypothetical protein
MIWFLLALSLLCAILPAVLFCINLRDYVEPPLVPPTPAQPGLPAVSILIPARNEAAVIAHAVTHALATRNIAFEVIIMDDGSTDGTDQIVLALAAQDRRLRLEQAPPLPPGWNGKQHACWALANAARNPILCFVDADVTLGPTVISRMAQFLEAPSSPVARHSGEARISISDGVPTEASPGAAALVSGFPRQVTVTFLEWLLLPLIHFVLLGFLPISRMRLSTDPAFAAGCGQFMMVRREAYFATGGHSQIKTTMHDGLRLPRLFRAAGYRTDLADITNLATCRMYTTAGQVWSGLAKNATEGIADPSRILPVSIILLLGQVMPFLPFTFMAAGALYTLPQLSHHMFILGIRPSFYIVLAYVLAGVTAAWLPRILSTTRFRQDWRSALLHPIGILVLLAIQWYALIRKLRGGAVSWRGRAYPKA